MKRNNKGFMLVEVIVTSTVVVTAMVTLYAGFSRLYNNYRIKNSYYNIDSLYATKEMFGALTKRTTFDPNNNINTIINDIFYKSDYGYLIKNGEAQYNIPSFESVTNLYNIENMIIAEYDKNVLKNLKKNKSQDLNQTLLDYIDYLIKYYDIGTNKEDDFMYIILTETKDGDNYYYANLRMR